MNEKRFVKINSIPVAEIEMQPPHTDSDTRDLCSMRRDARPDDAASGAHMCVPSKTTNVIAGLLLSFETDIVRVQSNTLIDRTLYLHHDKVYTGLDSCTHQGAGTWCTSGALPK